jgi:uncharacterized protein YkwD
VLLGAGGASASTTTTHHRRHHRAAHCLRTRRARGKAGSFRTGHRLHRRHRHHRRCASRRTARRHHRHHRQRTPRHGSAAADGSCTGTLLVPSPTNLDRIRAAVECLVNRERTAHGERVLLGDDKLGRAAQSHSENMSLDGYFDHVGPDGTPLDRMRAAGYVYSSRVGYQVGENIAWATGSLSTPRAIVAAWMASPGHRANILDANFRDTGVGVSSQLPSSMGGGAAGGIYTQDFGVIITG